MTAALPWGIPGYVADQFVGEGPLGDVWTGRALLTDLAVTLECGPPVPPVTLSALRTWGRAASRHPHLMPALEVVGEADRTVVVRDRPAGGSLATVLAHRGRLRPGEIVTVLAPIASALDHLHERAVVHAAVVPERIVFDVDGRPALVGTFVDRVLGAGAPVRVPAELLDPSVADGEDPTAATDVYMLASCGLLAVGGRSGGAPAALLDALRAGADPDPARRPTAAELALALADACAAEAVRLLVPEPAEEPGPSGWAPRIPPEWRTAEARVPPEEPGGVPPVLPPRAETGEHRRQAVHHARRRRRTVVALAVALLAVAGVLWVRSPSAQPRPLTGPSPSSSAPAAPDRWIGVIDRLDAVRAVAYERGDVDMLGRVWAPGGRLRADAAQLRALLIMGCTARGVRHGFDGLTVVEVGRTRVRLQVRQWLQVSQRVRRGEVVGSFAGSPPVSVTVDLVATGSGWRLA